MRFAVIVLSLFCTVSTARASASYFGHNELPNAPPNPGAIDDHPGNKLTGKNDVIVLADLSASPEDSVLQDALTQALSAALDESPFLNILPQISVAATLKAMSQPANTPMAAGVARDVCRRANGTAYVAGSITRQGTAYAIRLETLSCQSGVNLAREDAVASGRNELVDALDEAARKLRVSLGESSESVREFGAPLARATSSSLQALQEWRSGVRAREQNGNAAAVPFLEKAVKSDPDFTAAIYDLGLSYRDLAQEARARELLSRAFVLRERAHTRKRFAIEGLYYSFVTVEYEKAVASYQHWMQTYPKDYRAPSNLGSFYGDVCQYDQSIAHFTKARELNPDSVYPHENLVEILTAVSEFEKARDAYREMVRRNLDDDSPHLQMYSIAFLQHNPKEMAEQAAWFEGRPNFEHEILASEADVEAYTGHLARARQLSNQAVHQALRADNREQAAGWQLNAAWREAVFGNPRAAREKTLQALSVAPASREGAALAAIILARTGDTARAKAIASSLERRYPHHLMMQSYWLPSIQAQIALTKGDSVSALQRLQRTRPYDLIIPQVTPYSPMPSVVVRAEAYSAAGRYEEAAEQWGAVIKAPGIVQLSATAPFAKVQLARVFAKQAAAGNSSARENARSEYQEFLSLWKGADPEIPLLLAAKAESARL